MKQTLTALALLFCLSNANAQDIVISKSVKMSETELNRIYEKYVDKQYPEKVKAYKAYKAYKVKIEREIQTKTTKIATLMWQDDNQNHDMNWFKAKEYCQDLNLAGFSDWYLPSEEQLKSLYKNRNKLKNYRMSYYWTSYTGASNISYASAIHFFKGYRGIGTKTYSRFVRCVR